MCGKESVDINLDSIVIRALRRAGQIIKNGFLAILGGNILARGITVISSVVIARLVDKTEYAYLGYADNLYAYLALFAGLGLSMALLKFCSASEDDGINRAYYRFTQKYGVLFELAATLLLCLATSILPIPFPQARKYIWLLCLYPILTQVSDADSQFMRCYLRYNQYATKAVIQAAVVCASSIVLVVLLGVQGAVYARYIALIIALAFGQYCIRKKIFKPNIQTPSLTRDMKKAFLDMGVAMMAVTLFSGMLDINEAFLVNNIIGETVATANYKVANQFPAQLRLVSGSIAVYFFPIIARMKEHRTILRRGYQIGLATAAVIAVIAGLGIVLTPWIVPLIYGTKYLDAVPLSSMLWYMHAINSCLRVVPMNLLPCIGETRYVAVVTIVSCVVQAVLDYFFLTRIGIAGVAYASMIVFVLSGICFWWRFTRVCRTRMAAEGAVWEQS